LLILIYVANLAALAGKKDLPFKQVKFESSSMKKVPPRCLENIQCLETMGLRTLLADFLYTKLFYKNE